MMPRKPRSAETRARISAGLKGKPKSAETRAKISESSKGKKLSAATRKKIGAATRRRGLAPRTKAIIFAVLDMGRVQKEVAHEFGVYESHVSQVVSRERKRRAAASREAKKRP
jgi:DNA-directed RNA polymerase specialized sigma subunit